MNRLRNAIRGREREAAGWVLIVLGAVAAVLGWIGVSGKTLEALQLPYLASGGIGGLILTAVGAALVVSSDLRLDRDRVARLEGEILELQDLVRGLAGRIDEEPPTPARRTRRPA
jgi:hypothetical protein